MKINSINRWTETVTKTRTIMVPKEETYQEEINRATANIEIDLFDLKQIAKYGQRGEKGDYIYASDREIFRRLWQDWKDWEDS